MSVHMAELGLIRGISVSMPDNQQGVVRIEYVQLDIMARRSEGKPGSSPNGLTVRPLVLQKTSAKSFIDDDQRFSENDAERDGNCSWYESNLDGLGGGHHLPSCKAAAIVSSGKNSSGVWPRQAIPHAQEPSRQRAEWSFFRRTRKH